MSIGTILLTKAFGRPQGWLGRMGGALMAHLNAPMARWVVSGLDLPRDARVIEIGFGPGVGIALLAAAARDGHIAGIDPSAVMLVQARERNAAAIRAGRVDLRRGAVDALPFPDAHFDAAMAINAMQVWPDQQRGLQEIARVLKSGGHLALGFTAASGQSQDGARDAVARAGYGAIECLTTARGFCIRAIRPAV
ncbi:MAG: class I SAM-dependent methyltransferase [Variibacter sp.]